MAAFTICIFVLLIFYKIVFDFAFYEDVSIIGATICAIMTASILAALTHSYSISHGRHLVRAKYGKIRSGFLKSSFSFFAFSLAINAALCRLIVFGFSKDLNHDLSNMSQEEFINFALVTTCPIMIHYIIIMCIVSISTRSYLEADSIDQT